MSGRGGILHFQGYILNPHETLHSAKISMPKGAGGLPERLSKWKGGDPMK